MTDRASLRARVLALALPHAPTRSYWITLVSAALFLRAIVVFGLLGDMPLYSDALAYSDQAEDLVNGDLGDRPYFWPVGTSYVLAASYWAFGTHVWVAHALMVVVSVLAVVTTALVARRLLRDTRPALLAGWALALYPGVWLQAAQPFSFDLTLLAVNVTVLFAMRAWESGRLFDYGIAGLALGAGALTRPSTLSIALAFAVVALVALRRRAREGRPTGWPRVAVGAAVLAACTGAAVAPALEHNSAVGHGLTLSVNNELNLWLGNNPYTHDYRTPSLGQNALSDNPPAARRYLERFYYGENPTRERRADTRREALDYIVDHPGTTLLRTANRVRAFWGFDYGISSLIRSDWGKGSKAGAVAALFEVGGYVVLALLALVGLILARELFRPGAVWFLVAVAAAFELPYALVFSAGRWHYPLLGLLAVLAGAGVAWLIETPDRWQRLRASRGLWIAIAIFLAIQLEYAILTVGKY